MRRNRHDAWVHFCGVHRELIAATGLPETATYREHRFRDLLCEGGIQTGGVSTSLTELTAEQWSSMERFASKFFDEFESWAPLDQFPAYRREAQRRSNGPMHGPEKH